ncbi:hypothetical protein HYX05_04600 [Candidatus Woesearchaeota archaeon]|nr:hypothetical protein [Candidatus Woesearchaeota archaeon]
MDTLDKRVLLLAGIPREIYEAGRSIGEALELVLVQDSSGLTANYFNYDWANRKRENEEPRLKGKFFLTDGQRAPLHSVYQNAAEALATQGYFVEEKDKSSILLQPLATSVECINGLVDNFIVQLKEKKSPLLERPKLGNSENAYRIWLESYHEENGMPLPLHFDNLDKKGLQGMFYGITDPARIEQRLRGKQFVVEFYKAHRAKLPDGFEKWGHKRVDVLYDRLVSRYGNPAQQEKTQLPLFR